MKEMLYSMIATSERALVVGNVKEMKIYYCNQQMTSLYGVDEKTSANFMEIFQEENRILKRILVKQVKKQESSFFYNILTIKADGIPQLADLRVGYVDRANSVMFMEITPKEDTRMEVAKEQVNHSSRAEGIFLLDEKLTLLHCNDLFHQVFESSAEIADSHYGNHFSNGFQPEIRDKLLGDIHQTLETETTFFSKMKVITASGKVHWYSLEIQKRTLDDSGMDKILVYLVNIEDEVRKEKKTDTIHRIFSALLD